MIGRDDVVSEDLTEGVIVQDGGCVDVSEGGEVPDDVGQDVSRGPHLHQETFLGCAQVRPGPGRQYFFNISFFFNRILLDVIFIPQGGGYSRQAEVERDRFHHVVAVGQIKN